MPKNSNFREQAKRAKSKIYYLMTVKSKRFGETISRRLAEIFEIRAKERIKKYSTPSPDSVEQLDSFANSIKARRTERGNWGVRIPADSEGLYMFLEFGTGLLGEMNPHPEIGEGRGLIDWQYNSGDLSNRTQYGSWVFSRDNTYVDANDRYPLTITRHYKTAPYEVRETIVHSPKGTYVRKQHTRKPKYTVESKDIVVKGRDNNFRVMTQGLLPVRYIYDTKQEIREIFAMLKLMNGGWVTMQQVENALNELERRPV